MWDLLDRNDHYLSYLLAVELAFKIFWSILQSMRSMESMEPDDPKSSVSMNSLGSVDSMRQRILRRLGMVFHRFLWFQVFVLETHYIDID